MFHLKSRMGKLLYRRFPAPMCHVWHRRLVGRPLHLRNPVGYGDKINWLKLYEDPFDLEVSRCADKYRMRAFVAERGLADHLPPLLGVWDDPRDIDFDALPDPFVLKANHGSSMNLICRDPGSFDRAKAVRRLAEWLEIDFGRVHAERHYSRIPRKVICEALIQGDAPGESPVDYKVICFHGNPVAIIHGVYRSAVRVVTHFDLNWKQLPISKNPTDLPIERPDRLDEMLAIARTLSTGFPLVRVDLYASSGRVFIGEMTFTPSAGYNTSNTAEGDAWLGERLDISDLVAARRAKHSFLFHRPTAARQPRNG